MAAQGGLGIIAAQAGRVSICLDPYSCIPQLKITLQHPQGQRQENEINRFIALADSAALI